MCDLLRHETIVSTLNNFIVGSSIYDIFQFSGFIEPSKLESYIENRSKYVAKGKGSVFHDAVKQIEEYISDPVVSAFVLAFVRVQRFINFAEDIL